MSRIAFVATVLTGLVVGACAAESADEVDGIHDSFATGKADDALSEDEIAGALVVANTATQAVLDEEVGLDTRAARNIVAQRPFRNLAVLDAVDYVGPVALDRLVAYAYAKDLVGGPVTPPAVPCFLISEYLEGTGNYNKGVELWNCGTTTIDLTPYRLCLVRDGGSTCAATATLGEWTLAPGAVRTVCRTKSGTFNDPMPLLRDRCQSIASAVMTFSGNDRLVLFRDDDGDNVLDATDPIADAFGAIAQAPSTELWSNMVLRRCNPTRFDGGRFFPYLDYFAKSPGGGNDHSDYGVAPTATSCR